MSAQTEQTPKPWYHRLLPKRLRKDKALVHVFRLSGVISDGGRLQSGLALHKIETSLVKTFERKGLAGVAITINSPGGSPVQSQLIHDRIRQLAAKNEVPVWTFCEDVAASGGYWLACAGDEVYASDNSIIGSIGVVGGMFGFVEAMKKLGIERRVYTAGDNKVQLDPFLPEKKADVARLKKLQGEIHQSFIDHVRSRRGGKLDESDKELFSGAYWTGTRAQQLGLIDKTGSLNEILTEKFGDEVKIRVIAPRQGFSLARLMGRGGDAALPSSLAEGLADDVLDTLANRLTWARYGL